MQKTIKVVKVVKQASFAFILSGVLLGCSAHSPMIIQDTTDTHIISDKKYPSHQDKVFLTQQPLPANAEFEVIADIQVGKIWYGPSNSVYESMATRARELGADAVVEIRTWTQPSGFSWAAPHGAGKAVKLKDHNIVVQMEGEMK